MLEKKPEDKPLLLFDGVCNLCSWTVNFILKHEKDDELQFASLSSKTGKNLQRNHDLNPDEKKSLIYVEGEDVYKKSEAVIKVLKHLESPYRHLCVIFALVPHFFRDWMYTLVSKIRYRIFGKKEKCMNPHEDVRERFVDL